VTQAMNPNQLLVQRLIALWKLLLYHPRPKTALLAFQFIFFLAMATHKITYRAIVFCLIDALPAIWAISITINP
jgi:hypothetical protein